MPPTIKRNNMLLIIITVFNMGYMQPCKASIWDTSITVQSNSGIGEVVFTVPLDNVGRQMPTDIHLCNTSNYFRLVYRNAGWGVSVKSCLPDLHTEVLHFCSNDTGIRRGTLKLTVVPFWQRRRTALTFQVMVTDDSKGVVVIGTRNDSGCTRFPPGCYVVGTNSNKLFWISSDYRHVATYKTGLVYGFQYTLKVTCPLRRLLNVLSWLSSNKFYIRATFLVKHISHVIPAVRSLKPFLHETSHSHSKKPSISNSDRRTLSTKRITGSALLITNGRNNIKDNFKNRIKRGLCKNLEPVGKSCYPYPEPGRQAPSTEPLRTQISTTLPLSTTPTYQSTTIAPSTTLKTIFSTITSNTTQMTTMNAELALSTTSMTKKSSSISFSTTQTNTTDKNTTTFTTLATSRSTDAFVYTRYTKVRSTGVLSTTTPTTVISSTLLSTLPATKGTESQSTTMPTTKSRDISLSTASTATMSTDITFPSTRTTSKSIDSALSSTTMTTTNIGATSSNTSTTATSTLMINISSLPTTSKGTGTMNYYTVKPTWSIGISSTLTKMPGTGRTLSTTPITNHTTDTRMELSLLFTLAVKTLFMPAVVSLPAAEIPTKLTTTWNTPIVPTITNKRVLTTTTAIPITIVTSVIPVNKTFRTLSNAEPVGSNAFLSEPLNIVFVSVGVVLSAMAVSGGLICYMHSKKTGTGVKGSNRILEGSTSTKHYTSSFPGNGRNVSALSTTRLFSKSAYKLTWGLYRELKEDASRTQKKCL